MKLILIGDTHTKHKEVDIIPGDMVIFTGDFMNRGYEIDDVYSFLDWFSDYPAKHKIMIAGNHDRYVENKSEDWSKVINGFPYANIRYLQDSFVKVEGLKIWGTPHTKIFNNWAFNRIPQALENLYGKIPDDTDILVTHGPPYGVLDQLENGEHAGDKELNPNIDRLKNLKLHCFGHIHSGHGVMKNKNKGGYYTSVNCSVLNEKYEYNWTPTTIEL